LPAWTPSVDKAQRWCSAPCLAVHFSASASVCQGSSIREGVHLLTQQQQQQQDSHGVYTAQSFDVPPSPHAVRAPLQISQQQQRGGSSERLSVCAKVSDFDVLVGQLALQHAVQPPLSLCHGIQGSPPLNLAPWAPAIHCASLARVTDAEASCSTSLAPTLPPPPALTPNSRPISTETEASPKPPLPPGTPPHFSLPPESFASPIQNCGSHNYSAFLPPVSPPAASSIASPTHTPSHPSATPPPDDSMPSSALYNKCTPSFVAASIAPNQEACQLAVRVSASEISCFALQVHLAYA
jgi:hypothetical protein